MPYILPVLRLDNHKSVCEERRCAREELLVLARPDGSVELSPLYDVVPMGFYPQYAQVLSMSIGDEEQLVRFDASRWKQFADSTGLDTDRVLAAVTETSRGILEHVDEAFGHIGLHTREAAIAEIKRYNERTAARR